jgi:hypothetical protein
VYHEKAKLGRDGQHLEYFVDGGRIHLRRVFIDQVEPGIDYCITEVGVSQHIAEHIAVEQVGVLELRRFAVRGLVIADAGINHMLIAKGEIHLERDGLLLRQANFLFFALKPITREGILEEARGTA